MARIQSPARLVAGNVVLLAVFVFAQLAAQPPARRAAQPHPAFAPLLFVPNVGQFPGPARYQARGLGGTLWLADDAIWLTQVATPAIDRRRWAERPRPPLTVRGAAVRLSFVGAAPAAPEPLAPQPTRFHYYRGATPSDWRPDVPTYGGARYTGLYPGLDLVVGGENEGEAWLRLRCAGACPARLDEVRLRVEGAEAARVVGPRLELRTAVGTLALPLPVVVNASGAAVAGADVLVEGATVIEPLAAAAGDAGRAPWDAPELGMPAGDGVVSAEFLYGTLLGGGDMEWAEAIAVDEEGRATVFGDTRSADFPTTPGAFDVSYNGGDPWGDAYIARLSADGATLEYATFLGGSDAEVGFGGALGADGRVYLTGWTRSDDFPTTPGAFDRSRNGGEDAFVARLTAAGALDYATYLGGRAAHPDPHEPDYDFRPSGYDAGVGVVVDGGEAVVFGASQSPEFPTTPGAPDRDNLTYCRDRYTVYPCADAFITRLNATGSGLVSSTFLGGDGDDFARALALDSAGRAVLAGDTFSANFPVTPDAYDRAGGLDRDAFVAVARRDGRLDYATYLGGQHAAGDGWYEGDKALALHVAADGRITVAGETWSTDFPTTSAAYDRTRNGGACETDWYQEMGECPDAFLVQFQPGGALGFATLFGGAGDRFGEGGYEAATAVQLDAGGAVVVAGYTGAADFPTTPGAYAAAPLTTLETFIARFDAAGRSLQYGSYLNSASGSSAVSLAAGPDGDLYLTGQTWSPGLPTTAGAWDTQLDGYAADGFALRFRLDAPAPNAGWVEYGPGSGAGGGISASPGDSLRPALAEAPDGALYLVWSEATTTDAEIYVRRWRGGAWEEATPGAATGGGVSDNGGESVAPALAIAPDGTVIVAWADDSGGDTEIYARQLRDGTWRELGGSAATGGVSNNGGPSQWPALAVGDDGRVYLAWDDASAGNQEIYLRAWDGQRWAELGGSASGGGISRSPGESARPRVALSDGAPVVGWTDTSSGDSDVYVTRWNGRRWAALGAGAASGSGISGNDSLSRLGALVAGPADALYAIWADNAGGDFDAFVRRWDGRAWAEVGNGSASGNGVSPGSGNSQLATLALDATGAPLAAWYETTPTGAEVYVRRWDGARWMEVTPGSARGGGLSDNSGASAGVALLAGRDGRLFAAWEDNSAGNYEIYLRAMGGAPCYRLALTHTGQGADPTAAPDRSTGCAAGRYLPGATVTLSAAPVTGWTVAGWGGTSNDASAMTANTLVMPPADHTASVAYRPGGPTCYKLTLTHTGSGDDPAVAPAASIDCPTGFYVAGQPLALEASPAPGWRVAAWRGTAADDSSAPVNAATMPAGDHLIEVAYAANELPCYRLELAHSGAGGDPAAAPDHSADCGLGTFLPTQVIRLMAAPGPGQRVVGWLGTDDDSATGVSNTLRMPAADHLVVVLYGPLGPPVFRLYAPVVARR